MHKEADTCRRYVVPKLQAASWDDEPHRLSLPGDSTVNFDLMQMRQNYILMGCFIWLIGTINMATGSVLRKMPTDLG